MIPPAGPLRTELNDALVGGIRERGAEAVGLLLVGLARLALAAAVLAVLSALGSVLGFGAGTLALTALSILSGPIGWALAREERRRG